MNWLRTQDFLHDCPYFENSIHLGIDATALRGYDQGEYTHLNTPWDDRCVSISMEGFLFRTNLDASIRWALSAERTGSYRMRIDNQYSNASTGA